MQQDTHLSRRLRFRVFEADLSARELTKLGKRLSLQEQPFQLLAMLLEKPGELVTREELQASLWPQTVVDFDHGLNKAISKIRDALGDSADNPRFVQTIARRGYRFLADVTVVDSEQMETAPPRIMVSDPPLQDDGGASKRRLRRVAAWTVLGLALSLLPAIFLIRVLSTSSSYLPAIRSVAVMPLENLSGDASACPVLQRPACRWPPWPDQWA